MKPRLEGASLFRSRLYAASLGKRTGDAPIAQCADAWPGDPKAGRAVAGGRKPFGDDPRGELGWLRDLHRVGGDDARRVAKYHVHAWLRRAGGWDPLTWRPDAIGRRLANVAGAIEFLCEGTDNGFREELFDRLCREARHLHRTARRATPGHARIAAAKGLIMAGLCLPKGRPWLRAGLARLEREIAAQILPDGGQIERSPEILLRALCDLVDIRDSVDGVQDAHETVDRAIDRMAPMVRFFRHGDGGLAHFNGGMDLPPATVEAVLRAAGAEGRAPARAPHSGFERIEAGAATLIADLGATPPSGFDGGAHAGTLSFEFSHGNDRLVVNCGSAPEHMADLRGALRATAAHSTLILGDTNSSEIVLGDGLGRRAREIERSRAVEDGATLITAAHDGYTARFGLVHRRRWFLSPDGTDLRGDDTLEGRPGTHGFVIRFHLHPEVQVGSPEMTESGLQTVPLRVGAAEWQFHAEGGAVQVEDTVYCDGVQHNARQLVVAGRTEAQGQSSQLARVRWALRKQRESES